jgi:hypothetical protein
MKMLGQVLHNTSFIVNYNTGKLIPSVELVILTSQPTFTEQKGEYKKTFETIEFRFHTNLSGINHLIGELQAAAAGITELEQMASKINALINVKTQEENPSKS